MARSERQGQDRAAELRRLPQRSAHNLAAMQRIRILALQFMPLLLLLAGAAMAPAQTEHLATVTPVEDTNAVLHNPDMGWVIYENFPLDPDRHGSSTMLTLPGESCPEVDAVALMFSWQDVESQEGTYDFSRVDGAYDYWRKQGKSIQLRLSAESLMYWAARNPPAGLGTPDYVRAHLPPAEQQMRSMDGTPYVVVDVRNAFYLQRLAAFLRAVREHFDARRPVTLIDLRGFGAWGEWHSGFKYPDPEARRQALTGILDLWSEALPGHALALSYSYDPDGPTELYAGPNNKLDPAFTNHYPQYLRYSAFDHALTKTNITFRRDGCGGAVHSNERLLNEQAFSTLRRAPMVGEFLGGYGAMKKGGSNWVSWVVRDALSLHPNYLNLIGWQGADARDFARERPDLIAHGLRRMGYRLVPTRVRYPEAITNSVAFEVQFDWVNRGVGRALRDYQIRLSLLGPHGVPVAQAAPATLHTSQWLPGAPCTARHKLEFPSLMPGTYQFVFAVHDPDTGRVIALPLVGQGPEGNCAIGPVRVLPDRK